MDGTGRGHECRALVGTHQHRGYEVGFLANKRALIVGVASNRSIAWGIAEAMSRAGAELAFTYQNERLKSRVEKLAGDCGSDIAVPLSLIHISEPTRRTP